VLRQDGRQAPVAVEGGGRWRGARHPTGQIL
jgi:hypothetical protein